MSIEDEVKQDAELVKQEAEKAVTSAESFFHHHHHDNAREIVIQNYPTATAAHNSETDGGKQWWILDNASGHVLTEGDAFFPSEAEAWDNALFKLTQLNAWLLWKAEGKPLGNETLTVANWLDAQSKLTNKSTE